MAFSLGFTFLFGSNSLLSLGGFIAIFGVILTNCAAIALLISGREKFNQLFTVGVLPVLGYTVAYVLYAYTLYSTTAITIYCVSIILGIFILILTVIRQNHRSVI